jgi:hypothetical protein
MAAAAEARPPRSTLRRTFHALPPIGRSTAVTLN